MEKGGTLISLLSPTITKLVYLFSFFSSTAKHSFRAMIKIKSDLNSDSKLRENA